MVEDREVFRRTVLNISDTGIQNVYVLLTQSRRLPWYRYGGEGRVDEVESGDKFVRHGLFDWVFVMRLPEPF